VKRPPKPKKHSQRLEELRLKAHCARGRHPAVLPEPSDEFQALKAWVDEMQKASQKANEVSVVERIIPQAARADRQGGR
jgi:hypothetical protein